jgi:hypothetical protein
MSTKLGEKIAPEAVESLEVDKLAVVEHIPQVKDLCDVVFKHIGKQNLVVKQVRVVEKDLRRISDAAVCVVY